MEAFLRQATVQNFDTSRAKTVGWFPRVSTFLLVSSTLVGCATIVAPRSPVRVATDVEQASIYVDTRFRGYTSSVVELPAAGSSVIELYWRDKYIRKELESSYRWNLSLIGNLVLVVLSPAYVVIGLATDFYTGAAWEFEDPGVFRFSEENLKPLEPESIVIAPPQASTSLLSEEMAEHLEQTLAERYPRTRVYSFDSRSSDFTLYGYNHSNPMKDFFDAKILGLLSASHVAESTVNWRGDKVQLEVSVRDVFRNKIVDKFEAETPASKISTKPGFIFPWIKDQLYNLIPDMAGISSDFFGIDGIYFPETYTSPDISYPYHTSLQLTPMRNGPTLSVAFGHVDQLGLSNRFGFNLNFTSRSAFRYLEFRLKDFSDNVYGYVNWLEASYGPGVQFVFQNPLFDFYLGEYRVLGYNSVRADSVKKSSSGFEFYGRTEIGFAKALSPEFRVFFSYAAVDIPNKSFKEAVFLETGEEPSGRLERTDEFSVKLMYFIPSLSRKAKTIVKREI